MLHGYPRFTADIDLVINLEQQEAENAIKLITSLGLQARLPVDPIDFTVESIRESWIENKNMLVFTFMNGETVPVCDIWHLITMKQKAGRGKDLEDIKYLQVILDGQK